MINNILKALLIFVSLNISLHASQKKINDLSVLSAKYLINKDIKGLEKLFSKTLKSDNRITKIKVTLTSTSIPFFTLKTRNKSKYTKNYTSDILYENDFLGRIEIFYSVDNILNFTKKEKEFLKQKPVIRVYSAKNFVPYNFRKNGKERGLSIDIIKILAKKADLDIKFVSNIEWKDTEKFIKENRLDMLLNVAKTDKRSKFMDYTISHRTLINNLYIRSESKTVNKIEDFFGKTLGIEAGYFKKTSVFTKYPEIKIKYYPDTLGTVNALSIGEIDGIYSFSSVTNYFKNDQGIDNIKLGGSLGLDLKKNKIYMGVAKRYPELVGILNKALYSLTDEELISLENKWLQKKSNGKRISLSFEEKNWIENNTVKIGVEHWPPLSFSNTGKDYDGISGDILKLIVEKTGLNIQVESDDWPVLLKKLENKEIDLLPSTFFTKDRLSYGNFSKPYLKMNDYIYTKKNRDDITSLPSLNNKSLAVRSSYGGLDKLIKKFPEINIIKTRSLEESIEKVLTNKADALYDAQLVVDNLLRKGGIKDFKGVYQKTFKAKDVHFFTSKDKTILHNIINKSMNQISEHELNKIKDTWLFSSNIEQIDFKIEKNEIKLLDILPIKEITFGALFILVVFYLIWRIQIKHNSDGVALKSLIFLIIGAFLFFASIITIVTLQNLEKTQKIEIKEALQTVLNSTYKGIDIWKSNIFGKLDIAINDNFEIIREIASEESDSSSLDIYFSKYKNFLGLSGYYLISKDFRFLNNRYKDKEINKSLITLIKDKRNYDSWIIPPHNTSEYKQEDLIFIKKVLTKDRKIIAYLALLINPKKDFFKILENGRLGDTGEVYAFNKDLLLVSKSRFEEQLNNLNSFINLEIKNENKATYLSLNAFKKVLGINLDGYFDYRGEVVYGAWYLDKNSDMAFAIEIDEIEAMGPFYKMRKTIIIIVFSIVVFTLFLTAGIAWLTNRSRKSLINSNKKLNTLISSFDRNVIFSKTDLKGNITHVSQAFCEISAYSKEELLGKKHNILTHPDMPKSLFKEIWSIIKKEACIKVEIKNLRKDGSSYWLDTKFEPEYDSEKKHIGYSAIREDITNKKEVVALSSSLEQKVKDRTKELEESEQKFVNLFDLAPDSIIVISKDKKIIDSNYKTIELFGFNSREDVLEKNIEDISPKYQKDNVLTASLVKEITENTLESGYHNFEWIHKKENGDIFEADVILSTIILNGELHLYAVIRDVTQKKLLEDKLKEFNKKTKDSIEYASLIQKTLIPEEKVFNSYFDEHFAIWEPKDIVGGDIYLLNELQSKDECLLYVIDCTGHGVPGAFVTMFVKAIERQITSYIQKENTSNISPAYILKYFNKTMKQLLKQENEESISNAGFDAGILYFNKKTKILKYAGAEIPMFYTQNGELHVIKADRQSIGYKKSDINFEFKDNIIKVKDEMNIYISTDGLIDQNGGEKSFPYGKRRFKNLLTKIQDRGMKEQKELILDEIKRYQNLEERNDDLTLIGLKLNIGFIL